MTWYMTEGHDYYSSAKVVEVSILKSTSASVWVDGHRRAKRSEWQNYFETREEAVQFLRDFLEAQRDRHQKQADAYAEASKKQF